MAISAKQVFFVFSKILSFLTTPVTWIAIFLVWGLLVKKREKKIRFMGFAAILFFFFSNTFILEEVLRNNEFPAIPLSEVPDSMDVVIVLSGGMAAGDPAMERINFRYNTDRFLQALNLYKKGKAKKIMISGGDAGLISQGDIESHLLAEYFITLGIPESDIIIEDKSANTHENAKYSTEILKEMYPNGRFILITSASHLLRAYACFRKEGLNPLPYSVDRQTGKRKYTLDHLILPSPEALDHWDKLIHEWVGVFMYSVVGYI